MHTLLNLLAAIALLIWGTNIVRSGVLRVAGASLRQVLKKGTSKRSTSFLAGMGVTALLQSSTATALLAASFVGQGLIRTSAALALMLGADVGTAIMVAIFSLDLSWFAPLAIFTGVVVYLSRGRTRFGHIGKIVLGVGLIILALQMIHTATAPLTDAAGPNGLLHPLVEQFAHDVLLSVLLGAVLAIACWSSLAAVLLAATLAATQVLPLPMAIAWVLGANLGSGALAVISTWRADTLTRRVPVGNLIFKLCGVLIVLSLSAIWMPKIETWTQAAGMQPMQTVVLFHLGLNVLIAGLFIQCTGHIARLVERLLPTPPLNELPGSPKHLDPVALNSPSLAIGNAAREAVRLADIVQDMLSGLLEVLRTSDIALAEQLRGQDDAIDRLYSAVKGYLAQINREELDPAESRRWAEIIQFTINMEHVGDIVERTLTDIAERKIQHGLSFSTAGMAEIEDLHARLLANLKLSMAVFLNGDLKSAQTLMAEKANFRALDMKYADAHMRRLSDNTPESRETSSLHLDLLSEFKRINSLFCSAAYPILESAGVLAPTRLRNTDSTTLRTREPAHSN